jgi:hypothetical protein
MNQLWATTCSPAFPSRARRAVSRRPNTDHLTTLSNHEWVAVDNWRISSAAPRPSRRGPGRELEQPCSGYSRRASPRTTTLETPSNSGMPATPLVSGVGRHSWRASRRALLERRSCLPYAPVSECPMVPRPIPAWLRPSGRAPTAVRSCRMPRPACARTAACLPGCWHGRRRLRRHRRHPPAP